MKKPIFSIIIPTYNSETTLARAIESVLNQTFGDYEILIMDGLSQDNTQVIVENYRLKYPKIKLFSESDSGIYDAMNKGVKKAEGNWFYFMGSDDYLFDLEVLKKVNQTIQNGDFDVVYGNVNYAAYNRLFDGEYTNEKLTKQNICHQAIFMKSTVFEKVGDFNTEYKSVADWHHNIRWFYNNSINKCFINLTIAEYSAGGYSALNKDHKFQNEKNEILFRYGFFKIPVNSLIIIITKIVKNNLDNKAYLNFLFFGFILFCLKIKARLT